jgi:probable sporulation protein (polysaccharide deacetylase family)
MKNMQSGLVYKIVAILLITMLGITLMANSALFAREKAEKDKAEDQENLKIRIEEAAAKLYVAPIDATVDRIWRAIPGYNGMELDVQKTYDVMVQKRNKNTADLELYMHEVEPNVKLQDLGLQPIYKGNPAKEMVALMINTAWGSEYLDSMLTTLKEEKVKATFFLDGYWQNKEENFDLARRLVAEGHEIGNHGYNHTNMSKAGRAAAATSMNRTEQLIAAKLGVHSAFFAPPAGNFNDETIAIAADHGMKTVLWTLDTIDWQHPSSDSVVNKVDAQVAAGTLILMHPTDTTEGALRGIIRAIKAKNLKLGTVSETLSSERIYTIDPALGLD